jgi:putative sterol carrier protein
MPDANTMFETKIPQTIEKDPAKAKGIGAVFLFKITGDGGGTWTVNLKDDLGVKQGEAGAADCTIECTHDDWKTLTDNPSAAMQLYFQGKLKVSGNAMLATKLQQVIG